MAYAKCKTSWKTPLHAKVNGANCGIIVSSKHGQDGFLKCAQNFEFWRVAQKLFFRYIFLWCLDFLSCEAWRYSFLNLEPIFHVSWEHQELKFDWNALTFTFFRSTSKIARHNAEIEAQRIYFKTNWHCKIITNAKFSRRERIGTIRHKIPSQSTQ